MQYELMGACTRAGGAAGERGQGTVEYVGLVLLVAVLIAGVVKASGGFSDTGIAGRWSRSSRRRSTASGAGGRRSPAGERPRLR